MWHAHEHAYMRLASLAFLLLSLVSLAAFLRILYILPSRTRARAARQASNEQGQKQRGAQTRKKDAKCKVAIFLGSGGHTAEMLTLVSALSPHRYSPRVYLVSGKDAFSRAKVEAFELQLCASTAAQTSSDHSSRAAPAAASPHPYTVKMLPRARAVKQSFFTSPITTLLSFTACLQLIVWPVIKSRLGRTQHAHSTETARAGAQWQDSTSRSTRSSPAPFDLVLMNGPGTCVPLVAAVYVLRCLGLPSPKLLYVESFARVKSLSLTGKLLRPFVDRFVVQWPDAFGKTGPREGELCKGWLV